MKCSPFVISKVLAACMRKLITARARKNKHTARMLPNGRKDHLIPVERVNKVYCTSLVNFSPISIRISKIIIIAVHIQKKNGDYLKHLLSDPYAFQITQLIMKVK